jgi:menaquinone-9 beta-reductase
MPDRADVEVAVVGAGPAGSMCAIHLLEHGHQVVILDQSEFPRDKPCGDGLTPSAVTALERVGLGHVVEDHQPIVGGRIVQRHGREIMKRYSVGPGHAAGACVPRSVLDHALLTEALGRGAHLVKARVEAPIASDGVVRGVRYWSGSDLEDLHARHVVAADGVTSRMRRALFGDGGVTRDRSYAARAYFRTERRLDPLFDVYVPLEVDGRRVPGYAWVFPLGEHRANIGVGFFGGAGGKRVSIRRTFEAAVADLSSSRRARFGEIDQEGGLFGSPLATRFSSAQCRLDGIMFVGDAANTVDPLSGEGIAYAMHGARMVADAVHDELARGTSSVGFGRRLARRFPRLGHEPWRMFHIAAGMETGDGLGEALNEPFLATVLRIAVKTESDPSIRHTSVWRIAEQHGDVYVDALEQLDEALLAATENSSPLIGEIVHREIRAGGGPVSAATMLFTLLGLGGRLSREALNFASALALAGALPNFVTQMSDRAVSTEISAANDRLVVMATDFVVSRAGVLAAACRSDLLKMFARTACTACEGQMLQREDQGRLVSRHAERVAATAGGQFALAAEGAAMLAEQDARTRRQLEAFGLELGCAKQIASELVALVAGDDQTGRGPGVAARRGLYCLSVLDTARRAGSRCSASELANAASEDERALDVAVRAAERHGARAKSILADVGPVDAAPLEAIVDSTLAEMRNAATSRIAVVAGGRSLPLGSGTGQMQG